MPHVSCRTLQRSLTQHQVSSCCDRDLGKDSDFGSDQVVAGVVACELARRGGARVGGQLRRPRLDGTLVAMVEGELVAEVEDEHRAWAMISADVERCLTLSGRL